MNLESPVSVSLGELLDDLIDFWAGVCKVDIRITREVDEIVSADLIATQCIIEVVRESISNAVKHDSAENVTVTLTVSYARAVDLLVSHPVTGDKVLSKSDSVVGFGSHLYDELTLNWSLSQRDMSIDMYATFLVLP